jgi:hypothetical protein
MPRFAKTGAKSDASRSKARSVSVKVKQKVAFVDPERPEAPRPPLGAYDTHEPYLPAGSTTSNRSTRRPRRTPGSGPTIDRISTRVTQFANGCVSAGGYHSSVIDQEGCIYTWGSGESGQLGHGLGKHYEYEPVPNLDLLEPKKVDHFGPQYRAVQVRSAEPGPTPRPTYPNPNPDPEPTCWCEVDGTHSILIHCLILLRFHL